LTAADYRYAFSPLVGFMLVGLIASLLIKETLPPATGKLPEKNEGSRKSALPTRP
jgi:hypothetical protein